MARLPTRAIMLTNRCNRLNCPLAGLSGLQCYNMSHNGYGINLYYRAGGHSDQGTLSPSTPGPNGLLLIIIAH